jgi:cytidine deaminase
LTEQNYNFTFERFENLNALPKVLKELYNEAVKATNLAYAPYSNFNVGAAFQMTKAGILLGSNQENPAYPSGLCAERIAAFHIGTHHKDDVIEVIAVIARPAKEERLIPVTPCGACRQVLLDFESRQNRAIKLLLQLEDGSFALIPSVKSMLPFAFSDSSLWL